jgi:hypothetical protein
LLGLKEIQRYWMINNNILDLFFQYMDENTAKKLHNDDGTHPSTDADQTPAQARNISRIACVVLNSGFNTTQGAI